MASREPAPQRGDLIAGAYAVDIARPFGVGGFTAFSVRDGRGGDRPDLMAVMAAPLSPPRASVLDALASEPVAGMLCPLAAGIAPGPDGRYATFVIGQAPPGPALALPSHPWPEADLVAFLLRPAAEALDALHQRGLTHRAIRLDNLFRESGKAPVELGPFWAEPPASRQPALYEPPYVAMCPASGRGDGTIADDVHALGVVLLLLALGKAPLAGFDEAAVIRHKLELGGAAALIGNARLPTLIADLVRGMLAEDPEHRPPPALLADPARARARRVASRPLRKAQSALDVAGVAVSDIRSLAAAVGRDPDAGAKLLRLGVVVHWIRRSIGDAATAGKLEELTRQHGPPGDDRGLDDARLAMQAVVLLDPLAPLCWRGLAFWPDALGPLLVACEGTPHAAVLAEIIVNETILLWVMTRGRANVTAAREESRQHRQWLKQQGWGGGVARLRYALAPLQPCASPLLDGRLALRLADLLPALEASSAAERATEPPLDAEIGAMIAARHETRVDADLLAVSSGRDPATSILATVRLLGAVQARYAPNASFPRLTAWLARLASPLVESWRNPGRRTQLAQALATASEHGKVPALLALLDDGAARAADDQAAAAAEQAVRAIDAELALIVARTDQRAALARRLGTEFAAAVGSVALAVVFFMMVLF